MRSATAIESMPCGPLTPLGGTFDIDAHQSVAVVGNQLLRGFLTPPYLADNQALADKSRVSVLQANWNQCIADLLPIGGTPKHRPTPMFAPNHQIARAPDHPIPRSFNPPRRQENRTGCMPVRQAKQENRTGYKPVLQAANLPRAACSGIVAALFLPHLRGKECLDC